MLRLQLQYFLNLPLYPQNLWQFLKLMDQTQPKFIGFQGLFMYLNAFYQGDFLQLEV